jgi:hypothetical protein
MVKCKKAVPVKGRGGAQACETSRMQHFLDNRLTDGGEVVSLNSLAALHAPRRFLVLIPVRS